VFVFTSLRDVSDAVLTEIRQARDGFDRDGWGR
jgi:hypothetical protein